MEEARPRDGAGQGAPPPWLTLVGVGEDGVEGLPPAARGAIATATLVVGGTRHLALTRPLHTAEILAWPHPMSDAYPAILARRGRPTAVLASGDPLWFGVGATLARLVPAAEMRCLPAPSSISLACARLAWSLQDATVVSLCGRPTPTLRPWLHPGARLVVLSADADTPREIAVLLAAHGAPASTLHVMEALGGPRERIRIIPAHAFSLADIDPLNLVAIEVDPSAHALPLTPGLPDALFEHDGQITKSEVRAATMAALAPRRGETLWDIGCGSGSIAIEWLLRDPTLRATALDARPDRAARAARNAATLGVPRLEIRVGAAPSALHGLPRPHAVFLGGGATAPGVIDAAWSALPPGGRLVANSVTLETDAALARARTTLGGTLTRIGIERLDRIGTMHAFRPAMAVTQLCAVKP